MRAYICTMSLGVSVWEKPDDYTPLNRVPTAATSIEAYNQSIRQQQAKQQKKNRKKGKKKVNIMF